MAFYYVKSGGTCTNDDGRTTTKRTGSFASMGAANYYHDIKNTINGAQPTTSPVAGDMILVSDAHSRAAYGANTNYSSPGTVANPCFLLSVDDANCENEKTATSVQESLGSGSLYVFWVPGSIVMRGLYLGVGYNIYLQNTGKHVTLAEDCFFWIEYDTGAACIMQNSSTQIIIRGGTVKARNAADSVVHGGIGSGYGAHVTLDGVTLDTSVANFLSICDLQRMQGGASILVKNMDLTALTTGDYLFESFASGEDFHTRARVERCKINANVTVLEGSIINFRQKVTLHACDIGDGYHYFEEHTYWGEIYEDTTVYLNATYDGSNGFSANMVPGSNVKEYSGPLRFNIPKAWRGDLSSSQIITVEVLIDSDTDTPAALNEHEFFIKVTRPDATDQALGVVQESKSEDLLTTTPTDVPSSTAGWTGARTYTRKQKASVTIPALTGVTKGLISVEVCLAAESLDSGDLVYIDPDFDVSAA